MTDDFMLELITPSLGADKPDTKRVASVDEILTVLRDLNWGERIRTISPLT